MSTETINRQIAGHVSQASVEGFAVQATDALLQEGATALRSEDFEKALHLFGRLSEEVGVSFQIELGRVLAFNGLGQWEQSIRTLTGMLGMGNDEMVLLSIGMAQERLEQYEDALETYNQVIEGWPDDGDACGFTDAHPWSALAACKTRWTPLKRPIPSDKSARIAVSGLCTIAVLSYCFFSAFPALRNVPYRTWRLSRKVS